MSDTRESSTTEQGELEAARRSDQQKARQSAEANGSRTPEQIAADLAETRERLANTVDALVGRVQPKQLAGRAVENAKGFFVEPDGELRTERIAKIGAGVVGTVGGLILLRKLVRGGRRGRSNRRRR